MGLVTVTCPNCSAAYPVASETLGSAECCKLCGRSFTLVAETQAPVVETEPSESVSNLLSGLPDADLPPTFGRYHIDKKLDGGGMGTVYLAYDTKLDRRVALKVPHVQFEYYPETIQRLLREARAAASFHDPSFCTVYDIGQIEGRHYIAMEYVEGRPLKVLIDPHRPMPVEQAVEYMLLLSRAMAKAHERGILHRDLKPANVMINKQGELVILDFGLALRLESDDPELTSAGQRMGTPHYMSPEQVLGSKATIGPGTDIWAVGVMLYQLFTGQLPFLGMQVEVYCKILSQEPLPPRALRPDLDPRLEAICLKAMAKDPETRYTSMADLARDLGEWLTGHSAGLPSAPEAKPGRNRLVVASAAIVLVGLLGAGGWFGWLGKHPAAADSTGKLVRNLNTSGPLSTNPSSLDPKKESSTNGTSVDGSRKETDPFGSAKELRNSLGMSLVRIPAGSFLMGMEGKSTDEAPVHQVTISRPFYLDQFEVTQGDYAEVMGQNPSHFQDTTALPVDSVSWFDAIEFCNALSAKENLPPYYKVETLGGRRLVTIPDLAGPGYRLPTEAEWEYACRAGSTTLYDFGDDPAGLAEVAWFDGDSDAKPHPVGEKPANGFRLHDMHGNVREWCWDRYDRHFYARNVEADPAGPEGDAGSGQHVHRGGSWYTVAPLLRSSARGHLAPDVRGKYFGFRVARNAPAGQVAAGSTTANGRAADESP